MLQGVAGTFGDERAGIPASLDAMERGLAGWDASIRAYATEYPARHFAVGVLRLDQGKVVEAIAELTAAATAEPARIDIRLLRGVAYAGEADREPAAADFLAAWLDEPRDPTTAYLFLFHRLDVADADRAAQALDRLAVFWREQPAGGGVAAPFPRVTLFEEMPGGEPSFLPAVYAPAARELHLRHYEAALAALRRGWAADPMNTDPAAAAGSLLAGAAAFRDGRWTDAITFFESAVREFPRSSESRRLLGTVYWMNGEPAKAIEQLQSAIAINANDERSRITLADVLVAGNRMTEAERVLRETTSAIPRSGQAHWRLGALLEAVHRDADALRERELTLELAPVAGERHVLAVVAQGYVTAKNLAKAEATARARVAVDLNDADAHDELGQIYRQEGREADASAELTVASLLDSSRDTTLSALAQIHLGACAGRFDEAVEAARRALAKNPQNSDARVALELAEAKRLR